ncbi:MAG: HlyD family efflux transporter periplasmic adaptor subunit [bacterium]
MRKRYIFLLILVIILVGVGVWRYAKRSTTAATTYQTSTVQKGTLVVSVSASGSITADNRVPVTTTLSGSIDTLFVKNGDTVKAGQKILHINLNQDGLLSVEKAQSSLLSAQNGVTSAQQGIQSAANDVVSAQQSVTNAEQSKTSLHRDLLNAKSALLMAKQEYASVVDANTNSTAISQKKLAYQAAQDAVTIAQQRYDAADTSIAQAKAQLSITKSKQKTAGDNVTKAQTDLKIAQATYAQTSGDIVAPVAGTVNDIILAPGMAVVATSTSSSANGGSGSGTKVATVVTGSLPTGTFDLAEVDAPKVQDEQKATLTFDALTEKTYTGTVIGVDRTGSVSSGVTTYPVTIQLDAQSDDVLPNMSATASIITSTKENVLLVPSAAVKTINSQDVVSVMQNGQPISTTVQVGESSDTQTEITSGLKEGDVVVTATIQASTNTNSSGSSVFGGSLRLPGGGGFQTETGGQRRTTAGQ